MNKIAAQVLEVRASNKKGVTKKHLSKIWWVNKELAKGATEKNTQLLKHNAVNNLSCHFSTNDRMLRYKRLKSIFFTDTVVALNTKSLRGNLYIQVFVSDKGFVSVYGMESQSEFSQALHWFCKEFGLPSHLVMDRHRAQKNMETKKLCHQVGTIMRVLKEGMPWANRAEIYIGLLKELVRRGLRASNAPKVLWDYCIERRALIHNILPRPLFQNQGQTPFEVTFGEQGDISTICTFNWYQWVYYHNPGSFPNSKECLGRVLGPEKNEGSEMTQHVITSCGTVVPRRSLRPLKVEEIYSETEKRKRAIFDDIIRKKLRDPILIPHKLPAQDFVPYSYGELDPPLILDEDPVTPTGEAMFENCSRT